MTFTTDNEYELSWNKVKYKNQIVPISFQYVLSHFKGSVHMQNSVYVWKMITF